MSDLLAPVNDPSGRRFRDAFSDLIRRVTRLEQTSEIKAGMLVWWASPNSPPTGYLVADGREASRDVYRGLFIEIGTEHGAGDGETTFNVPRPQPVAHDEDAVLVGSLGAPGFQNGWANYTTDGTWANASYRRDGRGVVRLSGLVKDGSLGAVFTLPAGYRPVSPGVGGGLIFATWSNGDTARVNVTPAGDVAVGAYSPSGSNAFVALDGIAFQATPPAPRGVWLVRA